MIGTTRMHHVPVRRDHRRRAGTEPVGEEEQMTEEELAKYTVFHPLAEYSHAFGIAVDPTKLPEKMNEPA